MSKISTSKNGESLNPGGQLQMMRSIIDSLPDLVWLKDTNGVYLGCNRRFERFFGHEEKEILGKTDFDFVPEQLARFFRQKDQEALEAERPLANTEWITFADDGHSEYLETIKTPIYNEDGKPIGVLGIGRDITQRHLAETEKNKFRMGIESSSDAIFFTDVTGRIQYINQAFETIYGYSASEVLGSTPAILKSGFISKEDTKNLWDRLLAKKPVKREVQNKTKNGQIIFIESTNNPIINEEGELTGFISINRDISEKKKFLYELNQAKVKAEESDRLKSAFLNNISHELRTPLNAITGFSSLLTMPGNSEEENEIYTSTILKSSDQLMAIVHDIIDIASIEAHIDNTHIDKVNINDILERLHGIYQPKADEQGLTMSFNPGLPDDRASVFTDASKLTRILTNLLTNAIKFTSNGGVEFGYIMKPHFVEFFVKDSGIGIPLTHQHMVFDKFYQVEWSMARQFEGAGLGLPICKAFVDDLEGEIWLESEEGVGSTFYFKIPVSESSALQHPDPADEIDDLRDKVESLTALVVEDDHNNFFLLENYLEAMKFQVIHAVTGKEAVERCRTHNSIDIILMDIRLPEMNGYEATRQIRDLMPDVPTIAQTAYSDDRTRAIESGCNDFIRKPFTKELLSSKIFKYINQQYSPSD